MAGGDIDARNAAILPDGKGQLRCGTQRIKQALKQLGMKHVICVPEQMVIDGNFPTVVSPNPENPEGFALAVEIATKHCKPLTSATLRAISVVTMVFSATGFSGILPTRFIAPMR